MPMKSPQKSKMFQPTMFQPTMPQNPNMGGHWYVGILRHRGLEHRGLEHLALLWALHRHREVGEGMKPHGRYAIVDETGGLVVAAMAERMGILYPPAPDETNMFIP
jgi:hypothetical protein